MIIQSNYKNENNNISISIAPTVALESIITTVVGKLDGKPFKFKYYNFKEACQKFKKLEKEIDNI